MYKLEAKFESLNDFEREYLKFKITPKGLQRVFSCGSTGKESTCNSGDLGLIPGLGRSSGGWHGNPLRVFLPGESHGQRSLVGYSPWGHKESDRTEQLSTAEA